MDGETVTALGSIALPWGKEVEVQQVAYDSGLRMLRLRFREGRQRFTIIDLDAAAAARLGEVIDAWRNAGR